MAATQPTRENHAVPIKSNGNDDEPLSEGSRGQDVTHDHLEISEEGASDEASHKFVDVQVSELRFGGFSPRFDDHDEAHVAVLAGVFPELPPIIVHGPTMQVIDGVHRVLAARKCKRQTIGAFVFNGSETEASVLAVAKNIAHGKPLTYAEREAATEKILKSYSNWSDRRIALVCGLSPKTVAALRGRRATGDDAQLRVGRDGRSRSVDPIATRHRIAEALEANPDSSIRAIAAKTGGSQATVRDVRERMRRGDESVLPPRLQRVQQRRTAVQQPSEDIEATRWRDDQGLTSQADGHQLTAWLELKLVVDDEWNPFVPTIPLSRVYEIADEARRSSASWWRFAEAIESRVRKR